MSACFEDHGGETITGSGVEQILVRDGKVTGVALENGNARSGSDGLRPRGNAARDGPPLPGKGWNHGE